MAAVLSTAFLQRSGGSPVGSGTPQTGGGGRSSSKKGFGMGVGQMTVLIEKSGRATFGGADFEEKGAHGGTARVRCEYGV